MIGYEYDTRVFGYDADKRNNMKMSAVLKGLQTAAGFDMDANGMAFDTLLKNNSIFVVSKISLNVLKTPGREQPIRFQTWTRGLNGIVFLRDTVALSETGERLIEATTNWILIDPEKRSILRPEVLDYKIAFRADQAIENTRTGRLRIPTELAPVGTKRVDYTDCDFIGHMNNTAYADVVTNFLPDASKGSEFLEFDIAYHLEAKEGEEIAVERGEKDGTLYFRGEHPRGRCFEARVRLKE